MTSNQRATRHPGRHQSERPADFDRNRWPASIGMPGRLHRNPQYRRATIGADDWHGEFGSYDEWARLGPQPPYRTATFFDAHGRRCITQHDFARVRDDRAFPLRYRWEKTGPRRTPTANIPSW